MIFNENTFSEVYQANKEKGFHDAKEELFPVQRKQRLLMMVIGEASEAVEAIRKNHYADMSSYNANAPTSTFEDNFTTYIKDSFEDELADVCLRLFDFCGAYRMKYHAVEKEYLKEMEELKHVEIIDPTAHLFVTCRTITEIYFSAFKGQKIGEALAKVHTLAEQKGIDIAKHIDLKRKYNAYRDYKHGKEF